MKKLLTLSAIAFHQLAFATPVQGVVYSVSAVPMIAGASAMIGTSINAYGDIAGYAYMQNGGQQAYAYINGGSKLIPTLGGTRSSASGINDSGQIVGWSETANPGVYRPFLSSQGASPFDLGTLGGRSSFASGINNSGIISGYSGTQWPYDGKYAAFTTSYSGNPSQVNFGALSVADTFAYAINDSNAITGSAYSQDYTKLYAFIHDASGTRILDAYGSSYVAARSINNAGQITGEMLSNDGQWSAFFYDGTNVLDIGTLSGAGSLGYGYGTSTYSSAVDINDSGTIVGNFGYNGYQGQGFVYANGKMSNLNEVLESSALNTWVITDAMAINNDGTIVAYGYRRGEFIGTTLVLAPNEVPEPISFSLVLVGLLGILSVSKVRRMS